MTSYTFILNELIIQITGVRMSTLQILIQSKEPILTDAKSTKFTDCQIHNKTNWYYIFISTNPSKKLARGTGSDR